MAIPYSNLYPSASAADDPNQTVVRNPPPSESLAGFRSEQSINTWTVEETGTAQEPKGPSSELRPPTSHFLLIRTVGKGGFGEVWEAIQSSLGRIVAVKRIQEERLRTAANDPRLARILEYRFRQEAAVTAQLDHPNILPVYDFGTDHKGRSLLAMKLVRGRPWNEILQEDFPKLSVEEYLSKHLPIMISACQAVAFAHSRGIVHRDLKASQVMVGQFGEVLLMDWGLAIRVERPADSIIEEVMAPHLEIPTPETASSPAGTPSLMAPEQTFDTAHSITYRTDIYLLGGTLYYVLTGTYPHLAGTSTEAFELAAVGKVPSPYDRTPGRQIPQELSRLAMRCISPNPDERPGTAEEFMHALQDYLSGASNRRESLHLTDEAEQEHRRLREVFPIEGGRGGKLSTSEAYERLSECLAKLDNATSLWPQNPRVGDIRSRVLTLYARLALVENDLALARVMTKNIRDPKVRQVLDEEINKQHRAASRVRRQRVISVATAVVLTGMLVALGARYLHDQDKLNRDLAVQRDNAIAAREAEQKQRLLAQEEQYFSALNVAEVSLEQGRMEKARTTLFEKTPVEFRNWEWGHLMAKMNPDLYDIQSEGNYHAAFSPDGKLLATGSSRSIKLWDAMTAQAIWKSSTNSAIVFTVDWSPDARFVAGASRDNTAVILDAATGSLVHRLTGHTAFLRGLDFHPDGQYLATSSNDGTVRLWDVESGRPLRVISDFEGDVYTVEFNHDGTRLITSSINGRATIWNTSDWTVERELTGLTEKILWAGFFPDGSRAFAVSTDRNAAIFDVGTGEILHLLANVTSYLHYGSVSPDGRMVATGDDLGLVRLWDVNTGEMISQMQVDDPIYKVLFHPGGEHLFVVSRRSARMIELEKFLPRQQRRVLQTPAEIADAATDRVRPFGARYDYDKLWGEKEAVWNTPSGATLVSSSVMDVLVVSRFVDFSPDFRRRVVIEKQENRVRVEDVESGEVLRSLGDRSTIHVRYSPDGTVIATADMADVVRLWDPETFRELRVMDMQKFEPGQDLRIYGMEFSPDGEYIAVGHHIRGIFALWNVSTGELVRRFPGARGAGTAIAFSQDGRLVATGSINDQIMVWETKTGKAVSTMNGHQRPIMSIAFSPDGTRLVSSGHDRKVKLWDVSKGREIATLLDTTTANLPVGVGFSTSGRNVYAVTSEGRMEVFEGFPWRIEDYPGDDSQLISTRIEAWKRAYRISPDIDYGDLTKVAD